MLGELAVCTAMPEGGITRSATTLIGLFYMISGE